MSHTNEVYIYIQTCGSLHIIKNNLEFRRWLSSAETLRDIECKWTLDTSPSGEELQQRPLCSIKEMVNVQQRLSIADASVDRKVEKM